MHGLRGCAGSCSSWNELTPIPTNSKEPEQPGNPSNISNSMPIKLHLTLMHIGEFGGFAVGAIGAIAIFMTRPGGMVMWQAAVVMGVLVLVCVMLPRIVFRRLISARCPEPECGGPSYPEGSAPISYVCRRCEHRHETNWSENTSRTHHHHHH